MSHSRVIFKDCISGVIKDEDKFLISTNASNSSPNEWIVGISNINRRKFKA
jgi:hypothetical protein